MTRTDDRREQKPLPVTSEVGGEGGSFADRTTQAETFSADPGLPRAEGHGGVASVATHAAAGTADTPAREVRYATEPPEAEPKERIRRGGPNWKAGLMGAAAGASAALLIGLLTRRRR